LTELVESDKVLCYSNTDKNPLTVYSCICNQTISKAIPFYCEECLAS